MQEDKKALATCHEFILDNGPAFPNDPDCVDEYHEALHAIDDALAAARGIYEQIA